MWTIGLSHFFLMNFEPGVFFFDKKTMNLSCTYEGIGMFVDDWKINPISSLGGHGNRKIVQWSVPKINFMFVIHLNLAKPITNTLK